MKPIQDFFLFPHEWEALKNALQRDIASELGKATADDARSHWHIRNARMSQRILEAIFLSVPAAQN